MFLQEVNLSENIYFSYFKKQNCNPYFTNLLTMKIFEEFVIKFDH